jgi:hypothetical protein
VPTRSREPPGCSVPQKGRTDDSMPMSLALQRTGYQSVPSKTTTKSKAKQSKAKQSKAIEAALHESKKVRNLQAAVDYSVSHLSLAKLTFLCATETDGTTTTTLRTSRLPVKTSQQKHWPVGISLVLPPPPPPPPPPSWIQQQKSLITTISGSKVEQAKYILAPAIARLLQLHKTFGAIRA